MRKVMYTILAMASLMSTSILAQCSPEICYPCQYSLTINGGRAISYGTGTPGSPSICSDSGCQPFTC